MHTWGYFPLCVYVCVDVHNTLCVCVCVCVCGCAQYSVCVSFSV